MSLSASATQNNTLPLHDALPISSWPDRLATLARRPICKLDARHQVQPAGGAGGGASDGGGKDDKTPSLAPPPAPPAGCTDRKSTRLNSSHTVNSHALLCLAKKKE